MAVEYEPGSVADKNFTFDKARRHGNSGKVYVFNLAPRDENEVKGLREEICIGCPLLSDEFTPHPSQPTVQLICSGIRTTEGETGRGFVNPYVVLTSISSWVNLTKVTLSHCGIKSLE